MDSIFKFCERAAFMYQEHGVPDTAALALDKGAKMIEVQLPEKALQMYEHAVDIVLVGCCPSVIRILVLSVSQQKTLANGWMCSFHAK